MSFFQLQYLFQEQASLCERTRIVTTRRPSSPYGSDIEDPKSLGALALRNTLGEKHQNEKLESQNLAADYTDTKYVEIEIERMKAMSTGKGDLEHQN